MISQNVLKPQHIIKLWGDKNKSLKIFREDRVFNKKRLHCTSFIKTGKLQKPKKAMKSCYQYAWSFPYSRLQS